MKVRIERKGGKREREIMREKNEFSVRNSTFDYVALPREVERIYTGRVSPPRDRKRMFNGKKTKKENVY